MAGLSSKNKGQADAALSECEKIETTSHTEQPADSLMAKAMSWLPRRPNEPPRLRHYQPIPRFDIAKGSESLATGKTILYLAYGSNLCAATFQGTRGIRPISALNVSVPDLELVFDLPGFSYTEPRFANTRFRLPDSGRSPNHQRTGEKSSALCQQPSLSDVPGTATSLGWTEGLLGVVYEITKEEWKHVIETEGGGAAYSVVEVPCFPLEQGAELKGEAQNTDGLTAHTLLASSTKSKRGHRGFGQPSKRYLDLIKVGAKEHELPVEYQDWLASVEPFVAIRVRQRIGQKIFYALWMPWLLLCFVILPLIRPRNSKPSPLVGALTVMLFRGMWLSYDYGFKWVFGDGERTVK
ncbi:hypothetical protein MMC10_010506 [Thelotrema lepadinum]|nr:hypothetical protein [Thelotrema lepadinum]